MYFVSGFSLTGKKPPMLDPHLLIQVPLLHAGRVLKLLLPQKLQETAFW